MAEQPPAAPFFQSWEAVPANCGPPADAGLAQRIAKLSQFAAKNGPPFVKMLQEKQQNNPEYSFLNGGPGGDYFRWRLYCAIYNLDPSKIIPRTLILVPSMSQGMSVCQVSGFLSLWLPVCMACSRIKSWNKKGHKNDMPRHLALLIKMCHLT